MLAPLGGFRTFKTDHCVTGAMRHVYDFHDAGLRRALFEPEPQSRRQPALSMSKGAVSEDMLLGLGAGVGFIYWHMKGMPPFLGGRANVGRPGEKGLERTAGERTGVIVTLSETASASKAERALLEALDNGPVMIRLDMGFLPYLGLPKGYHFGGHAVTVAGYDPKAQQTLIADRDEALHSVPLDVLAEARSSKFKPFPPRNAMFTFDFAGKRPPTADEVWTAIGEATAGMLQPPISNLGVKGIRKTAKLIPTWPDLMKKDELGMACFNAFVFIDATGGTGGGLFRYMYGRFLAEAAELVGKPGLAEVGKEMIRAGDQWQVAAQLLKEAATSAKPSTQLGEVAKVLGQVADREQEVWSALEAMNSGTTRRSRK